MEAPQNLSPEQTMEYLPDGFIAVAEAVGIHNAIKLTQSQPVKTRSCGRHSRKVYIPKTAPDDHKIVRLLGRSIADQLFSALGGELIELGTGAAFTRILRNSVINAALRGGATVELLALCFETSTRQIFNIRGSAEIGPQDILAQITNPETGDQNGLEESFEK